MTFKHYFGYNKLLNRVHFLCESESANNDIDTDGHLLYSFTVVERKAVSRILAAYIEKNSWRCFILFERFQRINILEEVILQCQALFNHVTVIAKDNRIRDVVELYQSFDENNRTKFDIYTWDDKKLHVYTKNDIYTSSLDIEIKQYKYLTIDEIKEALDKHGIKYGSKNKDSLIKDFLKIPLDNRREILFNAKAFTPYKSYYFQKKVNDYERYFKQEENIYAPCIIGIFDHQQEFMFFITDAVVECFKRIDGLAKNEAMKNDVVQHGRIFDGLDDPQGFPRTTC